MSIKTLYPRADFVIPEIELYTENRFPYFVASRISKEEVNLFAARKMLYFMKKKQKKTENNFYTTKPCISSILFLFKNIGAILSV